MDIDPRLKEITDCLYRVAVKGVVIKDDMLLVVKEDDDEWWSLPGGGVDYGENIQSAFERELGEELGLSAEDIPSVGEVVFVTIGEVVKGIPKANLFYRLEVPADKVKPTEAVKDHRWVTATELDDLYLSPSTGDIAERLKSLLKDD